MTNYTDAALDPALGLAKRGLACFPVRITHLPNGKTQKIPTTSHGFKDAATTPQVLRGMWRERPGPLVGVATGAISGIDVLDIDQKPEARQWWAEHRQHLPATYAHRTRSGGRRPALLDRPDHARR